MEVINERISPFDTPHALALNAARLEHLETIKVLQPGMTVLDVGCGVGHLAVALMDWGMDVIPSDARPDNVVRAEELYPDLIFTVFDVEDYEIGPMGDAVLCYGLLYHLANPIHALENMTAMAPLLLLETVVIDSEEPVGRVVLEGVDDDQGLDGIALRLSEKAIIVALRKLHCHVYKPKAMPEHPDYQWEPQNDLQDAREGHHLRTVLVAARAMLKNGWLKEVK